MSITAYIELEVEINVLRYVPFVPAQVSGPPEVCYEAEPAEIEIEVLYDGKDITGLLSEEDLASLEEQAEELMRSEYR